MTPQKLCHLGVWVLLLAILHPAHATRVPKMPFQTLVEKSSLVFVGKAIKIDAQAGDENGPRTLVQFRVEEVMAGKVASQTLTFELPMGELNDGTYLHIAGAPSFQIGETYLLFIRDGTWNLTPVTNWYHSYFRLVRVGEKTHFVSHTGRVVAGLDASGFQLGMRLAQPSAAPGLGIVGEYSSDGSGVEELTAERISQRSAVSIAAPELVQQIRQSLNNAGLPRSNTRTFFAPASPSIMTSTQRPAKARTATTGTAGY